MKNRDINKSLIDNLFTDTAQEGARLGLLALMTGISEECWCAGWIIGLEYGCYEAANGRRIEFGQGEITPNQRALLALLSAEAGGWWVWPEGIDNGPIFENDWRP